MTIPTKTELITDIIRHLERAVIEAQESLNSLNQSMTEETKSSAGDKYETQREMLQAELNLAEKQKSLRLSNLNTFKHLISAADNSTDDTKCTPGKFLHLHFQNQPLLVFFGLGFGDIKTNAFSIKGVGTDSPLGQILMNQCKGDQITFNQKSISILDCF